MAFELVDISKLNFNPCDKIGNGWMLITAGNDNKFNTMTASWGGTGVLWNKNVSFSFVRPQRYTFEFLENNKTYSLCFFDSQYKKQLAFCGRNSGKEVDKIKEIGFTPIFDEECPCFAEATTILVCKKIYSQFLSPDSFCDESISENYENDDYHKMFVGEIVKCLVKK